MKNRLSTLGVWLGVLVLAAAAFAAMPHDGALHIARFNPADLLPLGGLLVGQTVVQKRAALQALFKELAVARDEMSAGKELPQGRGEAIEAKAKEAETLQKELDEFDRIDALAKKGLEVPDPALPDSKDGNDTAPESKRRGSLLLMPDGSPVGAYITIGHAFTESKEFKQYLESGAIRQLGAVSLPVGFKGLRERFLPISVKQLQSPEGKALATVGATVIEPQRIAEVVRTTEQDRLTLRDVLQVAPTSSNAIEYVVITSVTRAAAPTAEGSAKPEATMAIDTATAPVRTVAVWMPVTEQQLSDIPALRSMIDNELLYDLAKKEEEQIVYGSGAGQNLQGIATLAGVTAISRTAPQHATIPTTNIDRVLIGSTDVQSNGYDPNALAIHPLDWEGIVLHKGTDERYIWGGQFNNGPEQRIWSLRVVVTVAMKNPASTQRYMLVGDFIRGATLYDREEANVAVGFVNDDFIKNMRTIRAEERIALAIKRPGAFKKYETAAAV